MMPNIIKNIGLPMMFLAISGILTQNQSQTLVEKNGFVLMQKKRMPLDALYVSLLSENYKNNKRNLLAGIYHGLISNIKSLKNKDRCSSIIYIFQKKENNSNII